MKKVVCIIDEWEQGGPSKGDIVTVESVHFSFLGSFYYLVGYNYPMSNGKGIDFNTRFFRPVQDIGDQVEEHIKEILKKEDLQTINI